MFNLNLENIYNEIIITIVSSAVLYILQFLLMRKQYKNHEKLLCDFYRFSDKYKDTNKTNIVLSQANSLIEMINYVNDSILLYPIFSFLFNYKKIRIYLELLFSYNRNPIMLPKQKEFEKDYKMDTNKVFKKVKILLNFQYRLLILIIVIIILIILLAKSL